MIWVPAELSSSLPVSFFYLACFSPLPIHEVKTITVRSGSPQKYLVDRWAHRSVCELIHSLFFLRLPIPPSMKLEKNPSKSRDSLPGRGVIKERISEKFDLSKVISRKKGCAAGNNHRVASIT